MIIPFRRLKSKHNFSKIVFFPKNFFIKTAFSRIAKYLYINNLFTYKYLNINSGGSQNELLIMKKQTDRFNIERQVLNKWLMLRDNNIFLATYLAEKGYKNIAIYGYSMLGKHLLSELKKGPIKVKYVIDINANGINLDVPVKTPTEQLENIDIVIVSNVHIFEDIEKTLRKNNYDGNIVSLKEIIDEISV